MAYLQDLYESAGMSSDSLEDLGDEHLNSFQSSEVCMARLWVIDAGVAEGGESTGTALLVSSDQGDEPSELFVERICSKMSDANWGELDHSVVAEIEGYLADEVFECRRSRVLPLEFTKNFPVHLLDAVVGSDSIFGECVPCLVNPESRWKVFPIPRVILDTCGVVMPVPSLDEMTGSFSSEFAKVMVPEWFTEDRVGAVSAMTSGGSGEAAGMLSDFWNESGRSQGHEVAPAIFGVTSFREEDHVICVMEFPEPRQIGEVFFSAAVLGPVGEGSDDEIEAADFQYFVLEKTVAGARICLREDGSYQEFPDEFPADLEKFVRWVIGEVGGDVKIRRMKANDEVVRLAIRKARATVSELIEPFVAGELENFTVKVEVTDVQKRSEHMWLADVSYRDGTFAGHITEVPHTLEGFVAGQRFRLPHDGISDWMYYRDGKMYGNFILRGMLPSMPESEAQKYRAILAD